MRALRAASEKKVSWRRARRVPLLRVDLVDQYIGPVAVVDHGLARARISRDHDGPVGGLEAVTERVRNLAVSDWECLHRHVLVPVLGLASPLSWRLSRLEAGS